MIKRVKAVTLVELLIASAIFAVVMAVVYSSFGAGMFGSRDIEENIRLTQAARQILEGINSDLRNSFSYKENDTKFIGAESEVSFLSIVDSYHDANITQDFAFISYKFEDNKLTRLCRKNQEALKEESGITADEIVADIEEIVFSYGKKLMDNSIEWHELWEGEDAKALPAAVKVELTLKGKVAQKFTRVIYLSFAVPSTT